MDNKGIFLIYYLHCFVVTLPYESLTNIYIATGEDCVIVISSKCVIGLVEQNWKELEGVL